MGYRYRLAGLRTGAMHPIYIESASAGTRISCSDLPTYDRSVRYCITSRQICIPDLITYLRITRGAVWFSATVGAFGKPSGGTTGGSIVDPGTGRLVPPWCVGPMLSLGGGAWPGRSYHENKSHF